MMTERQRRFREQYRAEISPWYSGLLHIGVMYGAGIAGDLVCVSQMQNARWEWLLLIPVLIGGNFVEWAMHKFVMHRLIDVFALRAIYDRHTRQHHQYFTDNDATIDTIREFRIVFFPWRVLVVLVGVWTPVRLDRKRADQSECGLHRVHRHDRPLHGVRDVPLLLSRAGQLVRAHMFR